MLSPVDEQRRLKAVLLSGAQRAEAVLNQKPQFSRRPRPVTHVRKQCSQTRSRASGSHSQQDNHSQRFLVDQAVDGVPPLALRGRGQELHDVQRQTPGLMRRGARGHLCRLSQLRLTAEHDAAQKHLQHITHTHTQLRRRCFMRSAEILGLCLFHSPVRQ